MTRHRSLRCQSQQVTEILMGVFIYFQIKESKEQKYFSSFQSTDRVIDINGQTSRRTKVAQLTVVSL